MSSDDDDRQKHAADDPTAVWDEDSLKRAGFDEVVKRAQAQAAGSAATPDPPPATPSGRHAPVTAPAPRGGLSWTVTLVLAVAVGLIVYVAVRLFR